jgi:hypothetical protein
MAIFRQLRVNQRQPKSPRIMTNAKNAEMSSMNTPHNRIEISAYSLFHQTLNGVITEELRKN